MSMKKFFIALSVLAALFMMVAPSQANDGLPDLVPANSFIIPVVVAMDGSLDTIVALHEVAGLGSQTGVHAYWIHWILRDWNSGEIINDHIPYTPYHVVTMAVGASIIFPRLGADDPDVLALRADLDGDGTFDHYVAYLELQDTTGSIAKDSVATTVNHLVGNFYWADVSGGIAAGSPAAGREYLTGQNYHPYQKVPSWSTAGLPTYTDTDLGTLRTSAAGPEAWSALAYATSRLREESLGDPAWNSSGLTSNGPSSGPSTRFIPRWWLYTDTGLNTMFIWKSRNTTAASTSSESPGGWTGIPVEAWDNDENSVSRDIDLPYEINFFRVRKILPTDYEPTTLIPNKGGWLDIQIPASRYSWAVDMVGWSWPRAQSANAQLNWSSLLEMHKDIGTLAAAGS